ncbi:MAG TPA: hypothetical protein VFG39_01850 [Balneolaceae bacterium]|nr:hypothetical protein [Balneolaceae bacterium]
MDLTTIIIAIVGLSIFIIPVILDQRSKKKRSTGIEKEFLRLAKNQHLKITYYDVWRNSRAIGIDKTSGKIFFFKKEDGNDQKVLIDLAQVKKCSISKTSRGRKNSTDQVSLIFTFSKSEKPEKRLAFYHKGQDQTMQNEMELAEKWLSIINLKLL